MRLLAIDTAADVCAVCVWADGAEQARVVEPMRTGHAERLMAVIAQALRGAGVDRFDLNALAVSVGPGSFTGIRVGVATARGLALALKIPAVGVSALEALAAETLALHPGRTVLALLESGRDAFHAAAYDGARATVMKPTLLDVSDAKAWAQGSPPALCGAGAKRFADEAGIEDAVFGPLGQGGDIATLARLGYERLGREEPPAKPVPLYLRAPDAKPQGRGLLRLGGA